MEKKKKSRARSQEDKDAQLEKIIDEGKKLFVTRGPYGFGMRALARRLDMSEANLYNYVESKRELWTAIRTKYFRQYRDEVDNLIKMHKGSIVDLGVKWAEYFLDFASKDYPRFQMMYLVPPPKSKEIGELEKSYEPLHLMESGLNAIKETFKIEGINETEITEFFYYMFGIFFGAANIESFLRIRSKILEPIKVESDILTSERFRKYALKQIKSQLERLVK
ncbi:MAG TPA: TetR/AcrR family transcriptional regulator [Candidatus Lokiarchaeia archaeon]